MAVTPEGYEINKEAPITIGDSEPEPDISVVKETASDFKDHHPTTTELVIEVAVSSEDLDFEKANIYARAAIPIYIIIHAESKKATQFSNPTPDGYTSKTEIFKEINLPFTKKKISVSELFR